MNYLLLTLCIAIGVFTAQLLTIKMHELLLRFRRYTCPECKRKHRPRRFSAPFPEGIPCEDCRAVAQNEYPPPMRVYPEIGNSMAEMVKEVYSDPEAVKAIRKALKLQSERELFEDEAKEEDSQD